MLAQYRNAVARARPDDARDLVLARQFVLPGRCGVRSPSPVPHCCTAAEVVLPPSRLICEHAHELQHAVAHCVSGRHQRRSRVHVTDGKLQGTEAAGPVRRIMFMRPVKGASLPRTRAATAKYDPVWVTCDDLAAEGILVSRELKSSNAAQQRLTAGQPWCLLQPAGSA